MFGGKEMLITGCILGKNEEKNIYSCIRSLKPYVDEIIYVDNGSVDRSVEIAQSEGAKVILSRNTIIDEGRDVYLKAANGDWVFVLDADERLCFQYADDLRKRCGEACSEVGCFRIPIFHLLGEGFFVETQTQGRLFRNFPGISYNGYQMHASVAQSIEKAKLKSEKMNCPIIHLDIIQKSRTQLKRKIYKEKLYNRIYQGGDTHWSQYVFLGCEYAGVGEYEKAIDLFSKIIDKTVIIKSHTNNPQIYSELYLSQIYFFVGEIKKADEICNRLLQKNSLFQERVLNLKAKINQSKGNYEEAKEWLDYALNIETKAHTLINLAIIDWMEENSNYSKHLLQASKLNPALGWDEMYCQGNNENIFLFQNLLFDDYKKYINIFKNFYKEI